MIPDRTHPCRADDFGRSIIQRWGSAEADRLADAAEDIVEEVLFRIRRERDIETERGGMS